MRTIKIICVVMALSLTLAATHTRIKSREALVLASVTVNVRNVVGGNPVQGTVTLNQPADEDARERLRGKPDVLLKYCKRDATLERLQSLLRQGRELYALAECRLAELATLLGIDSLRVGLDFRDFERGEISPEEVQAESVSAPGAEAYGETADEREDRLAREQFVRECIQRMHELRAKNPQGALIYAVSANLPDEVEAILAEGVDVNSQDPQSGAMPWLEAIQRGHLELLNLLIRLGADVNRSTSCGTPLYFAVFCDRIDCVRRLLEAGADINGRGPFRTTPLIVAASQVVSRSMVELLLQAGADVRAVNDFGVTAQSATEGIAAATQTEGTPIVHVNGREGSRSHAQLHAAALEIIQLLREADSAKTADGARWSMQVDPEKIDILKDLTFDKDIKGPALFVFWRKVPVGMIRPVDAVPRVERAVPVEECKALRDEYAKRLGKWCDPFTGGGYYDTKEEAARELVLRVLRTAAQSPLIQAALREDDAEVLRLKQQIREQIVIEPE